MYVETSLLVHIYIHTYIHTYICKSKLVFTYIHTYILYTIHTHEHTYLASLVMAHEPREDGFDQVNACAPYVYLRVIMCTFVLVKRCSICTCTVGPVTRVSVCTCVLVKQVNCVPYYIPFCGARRPMKARRGMCSFTSRPSSFCSAALANFLPEGSSFENLIGSRYESLLFVVSLTLVKQSKASKEVANTSRCCLLSP
jgi:hypothetical protein